MTVVTRRLIPRRFIPRHLIPLHLIPQKIDLPGQFIPRTVNTSVSLFLGLRITSVFNSIIHIYIRNTFMGNRLRENTLYLPTNRVSGNQMTEGNNSKAQYVLF